MPRTRLREEPRGPVEDLDTRQVTRRWWNAPAAKLGQVSEVGQLLFQELAAIERASSRDRFFSYIAYLLVDGKAPASYAYSMTGQSGREISAMSAAMYAPPALNCAAAIVDVLKERVFSRVSFLEFLPIKKSDFESRRRCEETNAWMDAFWEETDLSSEITQCGIDSAITGTALIKTMPSRDGTKVVNTRVLIDQMRISPDADWANLRHIGQVSFEHREDLINVYAKKDKALRAAILDAPAAHRGVMNLAVTFSDLVPLVEGFRFNLPDGTPGRHVLALSDGTVLVDDPWTEDSPYSVLRYNKIGGTFCGKGVPANVLAMQLELDRAVSARASWQREVSGPHVQVAREAHVDLNSLEAGGIIEYTGTPVKFDMASGTPPDFDRTIDALERRVFLREGISPSTAGGDLPAGIDAAVAITAFQTIADGRLYSHAKNLERFIEDIGTRNVKTAAVVKPRVRVGSKDVSWSSVASDIRKARMRAFPLSKLPSSLPGQLATIEDWFKTGQVNAKQRARLLALPDPAGQLRMIAASENAVAFILDKIIAEGVFYPPNSQCDPQDQYEQARARYLVEFTNELEQDRLALLLKFISAAKALIPAPPASAPPTPTQGS